MTTATINGTALTKVARHTRAWAVDTAALEAKISELEAERTADEALEYDALKADPMACGVQFGAERVKAVLPRRLARELVSWREALVDGAVKAARKGMAA